MLKIKYFYILAIIRCVVHMCGSVRVKKKKNVHIDIVIKNII